MLTPFNATPHMYLIFFLNHIPFFCREQHPKVGSCLWLDRGATQIAVLVTKDRHFEKPTLCSLRSSLIQLKRQLEIRDLKSFCSPALGCGLDCLRWCDVKSIIEEIFHGSNISVKIYFL